MARNVVFRADASLKIGNGHVMRCLTLAQTLSERGVACHFICREHVGNLIDHIRGQGFPVHTLPASDPATDCIANDWDARPAHAEWLGADWSADAKATREVLATLEVEWLVVDHYALDREWEGEMRPHACGIMVIDDLADRSHDCDILLDQNLGRVARDYEGLVPEECLVLAGTEYVLLRPEFSALREYSLKRRDPPSLRHLLVTMGGVDQLNATNKVLDALRLCAIPQNCRVTVVLGRNSPWKSQVAAQARELPWPCEVLVDVTEMARLMADCDLAIGAAGSTSWERCVLGVPSFIVALAMNQVESAARLGQQGAVSVLSLKALTDGLIDEFANMSNESLSLQSHRASMLVDGNGVSRVVESLMGSHA